MKRIIPCLLISLVGLVQAAPAPQVQPGPVQAEIALASARLLSRHHYLPLPLDDSLSAHIFDNYLDALDRDRMYLLQSDVDEFADGRTKLDDAILNEDLKLPYAIFNRNALRVQERLAYAESLLAKGFRFDTKESYRFDRESQPWAKSPAELDEIWRKRVKNDWLRLKLAGKSDQAIRETLHRRYETALSRGQRYRSEDVFEVFMNAYARSIEPHTAYLGPRSAEDFAISMKLSLVGIGAMLQARDDYITITELVAGGPAARSGKFSVGDRIVSVTEVSSGKTEDVVGWRIDDVVQLIRGKKGTPVAIEVLPAGVGEDGTPRTIQLVRDTITLEEQAANKRVLDITGANGEKHHVGVITLPAFYQDFSARRNNDNYRSATRDVTRLLNELKADKVDAVLVDLRNNTGGSLDEAVRLTGLFIDQGPVVQQKDAGGDIRIEQDRSPGLVWDGPMAVMINRSSASASEIFAAAIQDYGRGLIIGSPSFGKGTVQTLVDLDQMVSSPKPRYGELKMTVAQFFRINGGTTQLKGVTPDIALPALIDEKELGESSYTNALPWTQIPAAPYTPFGSRAPVIRSAGNFPPSFGADQLKALLPALKARHGARTAANTEYRTLEESLQELKTYRERKEVSLYEPERRDEQKKLQEKAKLLNDGASSTDDGLLAEERSLDERKKDDKSTKKDPLLDEAASILGDVLELAASNTGPQLAKSQK